MQFTVKEQIEIRMEALRKRVEDVYQELMREQRLLKSLSPEILACKNLRITIQDHNAFACDEIGQFNQAADKCND